jgi:hypothetical protein
MNNNWKKGQQDSDSYGNNGQSRPGKNASPSSDGGRSQGQGQDQNRGSNSRSGGRSEGGLDRSKDSSNE